MTRADIDRFWRHVATGDPSDCWPWTAGKNGNGYGAFYVAGEPSGAHRVAWTIAHGAIAGRLHVLHRCDNPPCCNPAHLFLGTQQDNNADMLQKKRNAPIPIRHGSRHHNAKVTETDVVMIRDAVANGACVTTLAAEFGLSRMAMRLLVSGKTWSHVPHSSLPDRRNRDRTGRPNMAFGEMSGNARLTESDIRVIRSLAASGVNQSEIGRQFGIRQCHVSRVVLRRSWAHVP